MPDLKVVELFCGIGGFHSAFEKAKNDLKGAPTEIEYKVISNQESPVNIRVSGALCDGYQQQRNVLLQAEPHEHGERCDQHGHQCGALGADFR